MSLVIAFIGITGAVMAGDMREITFQGDNLSEVKLENELYNGLITTDEELNERAKELNVSIIVRDDKSKIAKQGGILIGEVSSFEEGVVQKRRLYASVNSYAITEIDGAKVILIKKGTGSNFVVLGNTITKEIANKCIKANWKNGNLHDAIKILILSMETASKVTASVSKKFLLLHTTSVVELPQVLQ